MCARLAGELTATGDGNCRDNLYIFASRDLNTPTHQMAQLGLSATCLVPLNTPCAHACDVHQLISNARSGSIRMLACFSNSRYMSQLGRVLCSTESCKLAADLRPIQMIMKPCTRACACCHGVVSSTRINHHFCFDHQPTLCMSPAGCASSLARALRPTVYRYVPH